MCECGERPCLPKTNGAFERHCADCKNREKLGITTPKERKHVDPAQHPRPRKSWK